VGVAAGAEAAVVVTCGEGGVTLGAAVAGSPGAATAGALAPSADGTAGVPSGFGVSGF